MINSLFGTFFFFPKTKKEQGLGSKVVRSKELLSKDSVKGQREWREIVNLFSSFVAMVIIQMYIADTC